MAASLASKSLLFSYIAQTGKQTNLYPCLMATNLYPYLYITINPFPLGLSLRV